MVCKVKNKTLLCISWSFLAVLGFVKFLQIGSENINFANNILYFILLITTSYIVYKCIQHITKKILGFSVFFSVICAAILVLGAQIENYNGLIWTVATAGKIVFLSLFLLPYIVFAIKILESYCMFESKEYTGRWIPWTIFLIIVAWWGMAYLALFPGIYDYDSIAQTLMFLVTGEISSHHPVVHSALLSGFLYVGKTVFNSYGIGLGIYSFLQMCFLAFVATKISIYLLKKSRIIFGVSMIFYVFFPLHYVMAVWATKDIIFSSFFALVILLLLDMIEKGKDFWGNKKNVCGYVVFILGMCLFRNNGLYALLLMLPVCFFAFKEQRKMIWKYTLIAMAMYMVFQKGILPWADVTPGNKREMLSIPCQQMAKVYTESPNSFTEIQKEELFSLIPEKEINNYPILPMIGDVTKNYFDMEEFQSDPIKYVKLYISIGAKHPKKYIEAFMENSLGFWYPNKIYPDARMFHPYVEFRMADPNLFKGDYIYIERNSLFPWYEDKLADIMEKTNWKNIPVVSSFFVPGTYFLLLLWATIMCVYRKNYKFLVALGLCVGLWVTLFLSPVALVRYAYPIIFSLPLIVYIIFYTEKDRKI